MNKMIRRCLTTAALLFLAAGAYAQDRDGRWEGERWRMHLFSQVREDLDEVQHRWYTSGHDEHRLDRTRRQLDELQDSLEHHRYDERKLDEVIGDLHKVVDDNRLSHHDRDMLSDDLNRMRDFREHHEHWWR